MSKINVLLVDDSAVVRQVLQAVLERDPNINVMGAASDPIFAMSRMAKQWPDVIVLDIEMPRMDGITFLKKIMSERPTPVVICSSLSIEGAKTSIQALEAGAISIVTKPQFGLKNFLEDSAAHLIQSVKMAAIANINNLRKKPAIKLAVNVDRIPQSTSDSLSKTTERVIAIGTSTGGTQALELVLSALPRTVPGIVIVQHMPEKFTEMFAKRLDSICDIRVKEAKNNDRVMPGLALIAPGGKHMVLKRSGAQYHVQILDGPRVNRHKPSVDVLFRSVAKFAGSNALGVILTGMGNDGANGLKEMNNVGAVTIAQDKESCVVFGMPKEAIALGAADKVLSLQLIPNEIMRYRN
jgi:two-component system chemotaxis response regulator CheB